MVAGLAIVYLYPQALGQALDRNKLDPEFRYLPRFNVLLTMAKFLLVILQVFADYPRVILPIQLIVVGSLLVGNVVYQPGLGEASTSNNYRTMSFAVASWVMLGMTVYAYVNVVGDHSRPGLIVVDVILLAAIALGVPFVGYGAFQYNAEYARRQEAQALSQIGLITPDSPQADQRVAAENVANLSLYEANRVKFLDLNVFPILVQLLGNEDVETKKLAVRGLGNLAVNEECRARILNEPQAIETILRIIDRPAARVLFSQKLQAAKDVVPVTEEEVMARKAKEAKAAAEAEAAKKTVGRGRRGARFVRGGTLRGRKGHKRQLSKGLKREASRNAAAMAADMEAGPTAEELAVAEEAAAIKASMPKGGPRAVAEEGEEGEEGMRHSAMRALLNISLQKDMNDNLVMVRGGAFPALLQEISCAFDDDHRQRAMRLLLSLARLDQAYGTLRSSVHARRRPLTPSRTKRMATCAALPGHSCAQGASAAICGTCETGD